MTLNSFFIVYLRAFYSLPTLLQQLGDQAGPAALMAGADARAVVAVKVFVKLDQVAPVRVGLELRRAAVDRPVTVRALQEDAGEAARELGRDLPQRHPLPRAGRALDCVVVAQVMVELLQ